MTSRGLSARAMLLAACGALACVPAAANAQAGGAETTFSIPAQDLGTALTTLARKAGREIYFSADITRGKRAPQIRNSKGWEDALRRLLAGSGLTYRINASGAVVIEVQSVSSLGKDHTESAAADNGSADIVVTGTLIRNAAPVGTDVKIYDRADVEKTGAVTLEQFARTVPQNFSSLDSVANANSSSNLYGGGTGTTLNYFNSAAFNLRGLGPSATLTLLNGQRVAPAGGSGGLVDVSQIPLSAIQRIEILTDGASALYGADAIAGVVNIILRDDFEGGETSLRYGGATDGGGEQLTASQLLGAKWSSGRALVGYQRDWNGGLDASERSYISEFNAPYSLLLRSKSDAAFVNILQNVTSATRVRANARWGRRTGDQNLATLSDLLIQDQTRSILVEDLNFGASIAICKRQREVTNRLPITSS